MSERAAGPWGEAPRPAVGVNATDFLAAQRVNRRNTWMLILVLLLLGGTLGYLCGALFEAYTLDRPAVAVSAAGVIGGGALISIGLIASAVTFAFGSVTRRSMQKIGMLALFAAITGVIACL